MGDSLLVWLYSELILGALSVAALARVDCYPSTPADLAYVVEAGFHGGVHGCAGIYAWYLGSAHSLQVAGASAFGTDLVPSGALFLVAMWLPAALSTHVPCVAVAFPGVWCRPLVLDIGFGDLICHLVHPGLTLAFELDDVIS